jgi:hypothetical protein
MGLSGGQTGSTLIEAMLATAIFAGAATVVYPMFNTAKVVSKQGDVRKLCQDVVRSKLDEYRYGRAVSPAWAADPTAGNAPQYAPEYGKDYVGTTARPQLNLLTVPSRSSTQVDGTGNALANNGFMYAKVRYNRYYPTACNGQSQAKRLTSRTAGTPLLTLGMRECIGSNLAWPDQITTGTALDKSFSWADCSGNEADQRVATEIPGFKLYVKLELATPWPFHPTGPGDAGIISPPAPADKAAQFSNTCPDFGEWTNSGVPPATTQPFYDFNGVGEGIKVTVTGVMDTESANAANLVDFAGLKGGGANGDVTRFMCSASSTVYPEAYPVRYYLSTDGRIYPVQGGGTNGSTTDGAGTTGATSGGWVLPSLYSQSASFRSSGITSFAVHPRNAAVYVLRPGSLTRYGNCGGAILDCDVTAGSNGVSDFGQTGWANVQEFAINPNIRYIGVDFKQGLIYGMLADRSSLLQININCLQTSANCGAGTAYTVTYQTLTPGQGPVPVIAGAANQTGMSTSGRLSGFFITPGGDDAYLSDYSSAVGDTSTTYSSSIYRATDTSLLWPIAVLPVAALTFSK